MQYTFLNRLKKRINVFFIAFNMKDYCKLLELARYRIQTNSVIVF
jgi:hypothetical protein